MESATVVAIVALVILESLMLVASVCWLYFLDAVHSTDRMVRLGLVLIVAILTTSLDAIVGLVSLSMSLAWIVALTRSSG